MKRRIFALLALCPLVAACATQTKAPPPRVGSAVIETVEPWREEAEDADEQRIESIAVLWGRIVARFTPRSARIAAGEGPLLAPDAALDHPELSPGSYSCRVVRIGEAAGPARIRSFPSNFCYITGEADKTLSLTKQTGSDLPAGRLYPAGDKRYIFLGARQSKVGDNSLAYGADRARNVAGVVERVAPFRWRLVAPSVDGRSIDIYELTPVPADRQPD